MTYFYQNIKNSADYQKSIRDAKLKMIKQNKHPFYWAGFIISGK